jgi:hypothetical protein
LQHGAAGLAFASHIEQFEKETVRADAKKVVEIASNTRRKIGDRQVSALERGDFALNDLGNFFRG